LGLDISQDGGGDELVIEPYHIEGSNGRDLISPWYFGGPLFGTEDVDKKRELSYRFRKETMRDSRKRRPFDMTDEVGQENLGEPFIIISI